MDLLKIVNQSMSQVVEHPGFQAGDTITFHYKIK